MSLMQWRCVFLVTVIASQLQSRASLLGFMLLGKGSANHRGATGRLRACRKKVGLETSFLLAVIQSNTPTPLPPSLAGAMFSCNSSWIQFPVTPALTETVSLLPNHHQPAIYKNFYGPFYFLMDLWFFGGGHSTWHMGSLFPSESESRPVKPEFLGEFCTTRRSRAPGRVWHPGFGVKASHLLSLIKAVLRLARASQLYIV